MKWLKQHKRWIISCLVLAAILAFAYWYGGGGPGSRGWAAAGPMTAEAQQTAADNRLPSAPVKTLPAETEPEPTDSQQPAETEPEPTDSQQPAETEPAETEESIGMAIDPATGKDPYQTDPTPAGQPEPVEPENAATEGVGGICTLSISCAAILDNVELCAAEKKELVPADGVILAATAVSFTAGESVFDLLLRVCQSNSIHLEYVDTPLYHSAYIEGIANLYEFDVGEKSGWMYQVNGWFPNYGCSRYQVKDGDVISWVYTCDLGYDVGGGYAVGD